MSLRVLKKIPNIFRLELAKLMLKFHREMLRNSLENMFQKTSHILVIRLDMQKLISFQNIMFQQTLVKNQFITEKLFID